MTIYIDVVLIENLIMNSIILLATGLILKEKIKIIKVLLASLLGASYSLVSYMSILEIYSSMFLKIILSIVIVYIAFNPQTIKKMWKNLLIFYLTSFVFGGAAFALIYIVKPQEILMKNGLFLGTYPFKTIILGAIIAFIIIMAAFTVVKSKITKNLAKWEKDRNDCDDRHRKFTKRTNNQYTCNCGRTYTFIRLYTKANIKSFRGIIRR